MWGFFVYNLQRVKKQDKNEFAQIVEIRVIPTQNSDVRSQISWSNLVTSFS